MVNTEEAFLDAKGRYQFFAPHKLRHLCRAVVKEIGIAEHVVELALDNGGIKETNLTGYMGDLILFAKLRRLDAMFAAEGSRASKCYEIGMTDKVMHTFKAPETVPLQVDIHFSAKGQGRFRVKVESEYGHTSYVALEEVEKL